MLLSLQLLESFAGQYFAYSAFAIRDREAQSLGLIALIAILQLTFGLIYGSIWVLKVATLGDSLLRAQSPPLFHVSAIRYINPIMIESVRSLAAMVFRLPLLIVPALVEFVRLAFVPYIVVFDPAYEKGDRDALHASRRLVSGRWVFLALIVLGSLTFPSIIESLLESKYAPWFWESPFRFLGSVALKTAVNLATGLFLFFVFNRLFAVQSSAAEE